MFPVYARKSECAAIAYISSYVSDNSGKLLLSGAEIAWDLIEYGDTASQAFVETVFGVDYKSDDIRKSHHIRRLGKPAGLLLSDIALIPTTTASIEPEHKKRGRNGVEKR